jgi:hypothetical protein
MTDKLEAAVRKGKQAAILMDDPILGEAFDKLEKLETEALLKCPPDELQERRAYVVAIRKLRETLRTFLDYGKVAQRDLDAQNAEKLN